MTGINDHKTHVKKLGESWLGSFHYLDAFSFLD